MEIQGNPENKENNGVETQSHMGSILSQLESTNTEFQNYSSLQDPHHQGFKSAPRNYFIPKIDMRKFDGKDSPRSSCCFFLHQVYSLLLPSPGLLTTSSFTRSNQNLNFQMVTFSKLVVLGLFPRMNLYNMPHIQF
jgi:hypothetical protein